MYGEIADKYGKLTGIHAHNNQQLAFANTIDAMAYGASYLDATVNGMGRGAGNCALELLLGFLKNPKYKVNPIIKFVQQNMNKLFRTCSRVSTTPTRVPQSSSSATTARITTSSRTTFTTLLILNDEKLKIEVEYGF